MWQHFKVGHFCTFAFYFGNEDHMGLQRLCAYNRNRGENLKGGITQCFSATGKWEQSERWEESL